MSEPVYRFLVLWQWGRDLWEAPGYPGGCWLYSWAQSAPCAGTSPDWTPRAAADRSLKKMGDGERKVSKTIQSSYCERESVDPTTNICICRVLMRPPRGWSWAILQIWSWEKLFRSVEWLKPQSWKYNVLLMSQFKWLTPSANFVILHYKLWCS